MDESDLNRPCQWTIGYSRKFVSLLVGGGGVDSWCKVS